MYDHSDYQNVDEVTLNSLDRFAQDGIPPGSFGKAVLTNNLKEACARADYNNRRNLFSIVEYCWNQLPMACWGSPEAYKNWLETKRESG